MERRETGLYNELGMVDQRADASEVDTPKISFNDVIHDYEANITQREITQSRKLLEEQPIPLLNRETDAKVAETFLPCSTSLVAHNVSNHAQQIEDAQMVELEIDATMDQTILPKHEVNMVRALASVSSPAPVSSLAPVSLLFNIVGGSSTSQMDKDRELDNKDQLLVLHHKNKGQTSRWLLSKVMGSSRENHKPIVSMPHLSIWRSWIGTQLSPFYNCCLSIIREAVFDNNDMILEDDIVSGTSSVVFLVSESIPWEIQKVRLHNVLASIPSGSKLALLILSSDVYDEENTDSSHTITRRLGLHDADMTRIYSFSVVFLCDNDPQLKSNGFLKDDKLREGLLWLAKHSPLQPTVSPVETHGVVLSYLRSSLEFLENGDTSYFGPNHFISIFNAALDGLVEGISAAASTNVNHWPSPEVDLLEKSSNERIFVDRYLPSIGWSSPVRIQSLIRLIKGCKLPPFLNEMPWLKEGSHMGLKIPDQKLALQECLISYMTQSCQMLNTDLAVIEAEILVQTAAYPELRGSYYYIIPRWSVIFRRIQNWRLINLKTGGCSVAYLLEQHLDRLTAIDYTHSIGAAMPLNSGSMMLDLERKISVEEHQTMHSFSTEPSFDEIVEICCNIPLAEQPMSRLPEPLYSSPMVHETGDAPKSENLAVDEDEGLKYNKSGNGENASSAISLFKMDDKLSMLLEKCTRLQDMIDEKLAFYF
ncbi:hypothetical protein BHE74_00007129 [Ensete ventricosum]|nr:hypothetical protein BHE74_00007129 [Ensete ventricosum]